MNYSDAIRRAAATFVAGATAAPLTSAMFDISFFKASAIAGAIAVWNFAARSAEVWLKS